MAREFFSSLVGQGPLIAVALHHGHDLRWEVARAIRVDERTRLREEDPYTGAWTVLAPTRVVVHRSRFEVDLNRPPAGCVYMGPESAWGIDVWGGGLTEGVRDRSARLHAVFYGWMAALLERKGDIEGGFVVYDLHSYNHLREGPGGTPADPAGTPDLNVGTGHMDRARWGVVVDAFVEAASRPDASGNRLDVRENVCFRGGYLTQWVAERFPRSGCALAIEVKKTFMDEWTGRINGRALEAIGERLQATTGPVIEALGRVASPLAAGLAS